MEPLKKSKSFPGPEGPVVLAILDGVGIGKYEEGDIVRKANTPTLDWLAANSLASRLKAHGTAVGMPSDDDMGNSEIGHNAIGCGRVFEQGASLVNHAIAEGILFNGDVWKELIETVITHNSKGQKTRGKTSLRPYPFGRQGCTTDIGPGICRPA
jgi:2,3-bisphosphoglycerate-independent phosphoglycerate mutase